MTTQTTRTAPTAPWSDFEAAEPEFAAVVRERFGRFKHHVLATVRTDGSPRVSGLEAQFCLGELWLGMMRNSRKALDLRRDPRFALHANPGPDTSMSGGDVRVSGQAIEVADPVEVERFRQEVRPPEPFHLFRVDLTEVVRVWVEDPDIVIETWRPGRRVVTVRRGSDDSPARRTGG